MGVPGGGGEWVRIGVFFRLSPIWSRTEPRCQKGLVLGQISVLVGKWIFRRPKEKQASCDAADAGLGVSSDAADAGLGVSASHVAT